MPPLLVSFAAATAAAAYLASRRRAALRAGPPAERLVLEPLDVDRDVLGRLVRRLESTTLDARAYAEALRSGLSPVADIAEAATGRVDGVRLTVASVRDPHGSDPYCVVLGSVPADLPPLSLDALPPVVGSPADEVEAFERRFAVHAPAETAALLLTPAVRRALLAGDPWRPSWVRAVGSHVAAASLSAPGPDDAEVLGRVVAGLVAAFPPAVSARYPLQ